MERSEMRDQASEPPRRSRIALRFIRATTLRLHPGYDGRGRRKNDDGIFEKYVKGEKQPIISIPYPYYEKAEE
jgi:hypothetical protein